MERIVRARQGAVRRTGRFTDEQIATRATWSGVPDSLSDLSTLAALNAVKTERHKASTVTHVNPLDPVYDHPKVGESNSHWAECPSVGHCLCPQRTVIIR